MKIVLLADNFPSPGRPKFVFVQQLVFALADLGHEVSVIASQSISHALIHKEKLLPRKNISYTNKGNSFTEYRPYSISFGNGNKNLYKFAHAFNHKELYKVLNKLSPDVLYGHFWHSAYKMIDYAELKKIPLFVACGEGDNAIESLVDSLKESDKQRLLTLVNGVISVSTENKNKCITLGLAKQENIIVLPNCVDSSLYYPNKNTEIKDKLGLKNNDFLIVFVGAFIERKGPDRLLEAVKKLKDRNIKITFIGSHIGGKLIELSDESIVYKGNVEHDLLPSYLNAADLFVLPTLKEGCSNAIVEALACGLPVVSSNRSFNDDILNENNSIRVNPNDVDAIAAAIYKFKNDKVFYEEKKNYVIKHCGDYSIIERAKNIIKFIESKC